MHSVGRNAALAVVFLGAALVSYVGCAEAPYLGGSCAVNDDCQSEYQSVPGTGCVNGSCQCLDPSHKICCARGEAPPDCFLSCRPCEECAVGTEGCPSGCQSDAECPGPPDAQCGIGRCVEGECALEIKPGPLASQLRGDCARVECTVTGEVVTVEDVADLYNDGKQCTYDSCSPSGPLNEPLPNGVTCPESGAGRCWEGSCVDCYDADPNMNDCPAGFACDGTVCVVGHCTNGVPDGGETDVDCGGPCRQCYIGQSCQMGSDCQEKVCTMGACKAPTCQDGQHNNAETGVDCGAPSCPLCDAGQGCETAADCASGVCWAGACEEPSCFDGVRNGDEAGTDCGPVCDVPCP